MIRRDSLAILGLALSLLSPCFGIAREGGSGVGNSDGVVRNSDGSEDLADGYMPRPTSKPKKFSELAQTLREELEMMGRFLVRYGAPVGVELVRSPTDIPQFNEDTQAKLQLKNNALSRSAQAQFIVRSVKSDLVQYYFVDQLPTQCKPTNDTAGSAEVTAWHMVACTNGYRTWILAPAFEKLSLQQQALLIIHERLHSVPFQEHDVLGDVTAGLKVVLDLTEKQRKGDRSPLTREQHERLEAMLSAIAVLLVDQNDPLATEFISNWGIHDLGGGLVHERADVAADAFVGAGSVLSRASVAKPRSTIINSACFLPACVVTEGASLVDSTIAPSVATLDSPPARLDFAVRLQPGARISRSYLSRHFAADSPDGIIVSGGGRIDDSPIQNFSTIQVGEGSVLGAAKLSFPGNSNTLVNLLIDRNSSLARWTAVPRYPRQAPKEITISVPADHIVSFAASGACPDPFPFIELTGDQAITEPGSLPAACKRP